MPENIIKVTVLGSGTSSGVPTISCNCPVCTSEDKRNHRLRASILIESPETTVVIDTSPDFRQQLLTYGVNKLDAVVFTHPHFDHIGGFDDLRAFNYTTRRTVPIYLNQYTYDKLIRTFFYAFEEPEQLGGGLPMVDVHIIDGQPFRIGALEFIPIPLKHGIMDVLGFRIGEFAYCTDTNYIPESSYELLSGVKSLIIDALRYSKHETHFTIIEAVEAAKRIDADIAYFTHIAHQIEHSECESKLNNRVKLAYDGLILKI